MEKIFSSLPAVQKEKILNRFSEFLDRFEMLTYLDKTIEITEYLYLSYIEGEYYKSDTKNERSEFAAFIFEFIRFINDIRTINAESKTEKEFEFAYPYSGESK